MIFTKSVKLGVDSYDLLILQYYKNGGGRILEIISCTFNAHVIFTRDLSQIHTTTTTETTKTTESTNTNNDFATRSNKSEIRPTKL
jgi:hypothetical protein